MLINIVKIIAMVLITMVLLAFTLPRMIIVERSLLISATSQKIYPFISSHKEMKKWSPWLKRDPKAVIIFSGVDAGKGAKMSWQSKHPDVGSGHSTIVMSVKDKVSVMALDFGKQGKALAILRLEEVTGGVKVIWSMKSDTGWDPVMRWLGFLYFDRWIGVDYEQGLENLKGLLE